MCCRAMGVDPKTVRRDRPPDNPEIRLDMNNIAEKRHRFGYRRIGVMLVRVGMIMNEKTLYPLVGRRFAFKGRKADLSGRGPVSAPPP